MRFAIVSCGPSLAQVTQDDLAGFDCIIAVNEAALQVPPCDWLSCGDANRLLAMRTKHGENHLLDALPSKVLMIDNDIDRIREAAPGFASQFEFKGWNELRGELPGSIPRGWDTFSSTAALALAGMKATEIVCFGVDMHGETDFAGVQTPERNAQRWAEEQSIWNSLVEWLDGHGVKVVLGRGSDSCGDSGETIQRK